MENEGCMNRDELCVCAQLPSNLISRKNVTEGFVSQKQKEKSTNVQVYECSFICEASFLSCYELVTVGQRMKPVSLQNMKRSAY